MDSVNVNNVESTEHISLSDANEGSDPTRKRARLKDDEVEAPAVLTDVTDEEEYECSYDADAYPSSRVKSLLDSFQWIPLDPNLKEEFSALKSWLDNTIPRRRFDVNISKEVKTAAVEALPQSKSTLNLPIKIVVKREHKRQLHIPLLSMVVNTIPKPRGPPKESYSDTANYQKGVDSKKINIPEWTGRSVIISSTEGRLFSFSGGRINELDITLDCYGCITSVAKRTPTDAKNTCEWNNYLFFGTCEGYLCIVCCDTFVRKISVGSSVTCVEVCPEAGQKFLCRLLSFPD